jgi:tocopherol O-methyltransferase
VQFHVADFYTTMLASESFDVAWALESGCYAEDKQLLVQELWRLLKPGGRLVVADAFLTRPALSKDEWRLVERWSRGWAIPSVASVDQFLAWLREAGFREIGFADITHHVAPSSRRIYLASVLFYPLGRLLHTLGWRTDLQTRGIASGYYQYQARRRGLGIYGIFRAVK